MRFLRLYLRSRRVPLALVTATAVIAVTWALCRAYANSPTANAQTVSLAVMLAVVAFGTTLGGFDEDLDRAASARWPIRRAVHLLLTAAVIVALLFLTTFTEARFEPLTLVLRNTAGLLGLTALGAALVGVARAWIAPLVWTLVAVLPVLGPSTKPGVQVVAWLVQPVGTTVAGVCAAVLAAGGLAAYALHGCPRQPDPIR